MTHRFPVLLATLVFLTGCSKDPNVLHRPGQPDYIRVTDDALMDRAIKTAVESQGQFVQALAHKGAKGGGAGFAIKKGFPTTGDEEHIWLNELEWDGVVFHATVNNEPVETKAVKFGDRLEVDPKDISDWMYVKNGVLQGGYTIRVLHYQSSKEDQEAFLKEVPFSIPPIDF